MVKIAPFTGLCGNTVTRLLNFLRESIAQTCEVNRTFRGSVVVDEKSFGPRRIAGKAGRGAGRRTIVFGICKRHGMVYIEVATNCSQSTVLAAIRGKVDLRSVIHSDGFNGCDGLVDMVYKKHPCVDHARNEFSGRAIRGNHINGIEAFWSYDKAKLARFRGCTPARYTSTLKNADSASTTARKTVATPCSHSVTRTRNAIHDPLAFVCITTLFAHIFGARSDLQTEATPQRLRTCCVTIVFEMT